ncbi:OsmC family protein [Comamonas sp. CMM03]|uniref:OsmC family protein n=1 Tax=Comamonas sp. CMM03 TaxID=2854781 RepID=UPI001C4889C6|nr:OsmC family protein [Comamonas sp. CMM03]MBV7417128.1 OsmC family protein [Comamonas sp. CMM03]
MDCTLTLLTDGTTPFFQVQNSGPEPLRIRAPALQQVSTTAPDAPAPAGASGTAAPVLASPLEVMLSGATGCSAYDISNRLQERGIHVTAMTVYTQAERATTPPRVFTSVHLHYRITAPQADREAVASVVDMSVHAHCSALGILKHTAQIAYTLDLTV